MKDDKMVAVSTFCSWTSYGSMLQAYALKHTMEKMGYSSYILIDRAVSTPAMKCRIPRTLNIKSLVYGCLCHRLQDAVTAQYEKSNRFLRDNIDIIYYNGYQELALNYLKAEYYLIGSDQVFNPDNLSPGLFFDYIDDKSKLLTYACSMGSTHVKLEREDLFRKRLENFSRISVRESDNIPVLSKYNPSVEYYTHIDPTFLLNSDEWKEKENPYPIEGDYILLYPLYWDKKYNRELKKLKKKTGLKIIGVFSSGYNTVFCDEKLYDVGVAEFIWLIDHAKAVVTSSFHGAALSIILEKNLCIVTDPNMPSRLVSLAQNFGIVKCDIDSVLKQNTDYENVKQKICAEQEKSRKYLEESLHAK